MIDKEQTGSTKRLSVAYVLRVSKNVIEYLSGCRPKDKEIVGFCSTIIAL